MNGEKRGNSTSEKKKRGEFQFEEKTVLKLLNNGDIAWVSR